MSPRGRRAGREAPRVFVASRKGRFLVAEPLFERGAQTPLVPGSERIGTGDIVLAGPARDRVKAIALLGRADRPRDVVTALLADRGIDRTFDPALEADAARAAATPTGPSDHGDRRDLTDLDTFTVDPASAHDFDDAVSAQPFGGGIRIWIHIADVAHHVKPGSGLDREALRRANSTYVPGAVAPMLPQALSDDACSLAPGRERLAFTTEIELSRAGVVGRVSFYRTVIRSDARMDYDQLDRIFAGSEPAPGRLAEPLALAREAAAALESHRPEDAIDVAGSEPEFEFDDEGRVVAARAVPQTEAHRLIERLMILVNEQVASFLERRHVSFLYRVHEQPDPARVERLFDQLESVGVPTPPMPENPSGAEAARLLGAASRLVARAAEQRGHGSEAYTSLVLRSMKQAYYSSRNLGHAGLGSGAYTHFTSPIRRYPDLIAHRALISELGGAAPGPSPDDVAEAGWRCSERERESTRIERAADDVCAGYLLERELFESGWETTFEGEVSGVIGAGAFVRFGGELADVYEGFLPARLIPGDRFELSEVETALVGRSSGRELRMGDPVTVKVESVEAPRGRVDLSPVGEES